MCSSSAACVRSFRLPSLQLRAIVPAMHEVLSKTVDSRIPLLETEFYELSLMDEVNELGTRHVVKQWHAEWSEIDRQIIWDREEVEYFSILAAAEQRYAERRLALAEKGFIYSDINLALTWNPLLSFRPRTQKCNTL